LDHLERKLKEGEKPHVMQISNLCSNEIFVMTMKGGGGNWKDMHYARAKLENLKEGDRIGGK